MRIIKCPRCGNTKDFYEQTFIIQYNYLHQREDGRIDKVGIEQNNNPSHNSKIYCSSCREEIDEDYHLFLDRYTETLFDTV
ncbi:hypothetical protein ES703_80449 [subsurface metagenome]